METLATQAKPSMVLGLVRLPNITFSVSSTGLSLGSFGAVKKIFFTQLIFADFFA